MSRKKTVWIPALIMAAVALLLLVYYFTMSNHAKGDFQPNPPSHGEAPSAGGIKEPRGEREDNSDGYFTTMGTVAVFLSAASFSWLWFKRKQKSQSSLVRRAGKLLYSVHKLLGWATLLLIAIHGAYFLITKNNNHNIYSGLAGFALLLAIVGYGYFIPNIRNIWMRSVHRVLGLLWAPVLMLHAGGSAIAAVIGTTALGGIVNLLQRMARQEKGQINES